MSAPDPIDETALRSLFDSLTRYSAVVLAVSGGIDSMAMMHLVARWVALQQGAATSTASPRITVATVDHGLRSGSADEAAFVANEAARLGFEHETLSWQGEKPVSGVQAAARDARYGLLVACARQRGAEAILTAHTLDDQAETVLMRLARGSGVDGLSAMAVQGHRQGIVLLRPLLVLSKAELQAVLQQIGGTWIEDPSNDNAGFERVRIRNAMRVLDDLGIEASSLAASAERLARARRALEAGASALVACAVSAEITGLVCINRRPFFEVPEEIALRTLGRAIALAGGGQALRLSRLEAVFSAIRAAPPVGVTLAGAMIRASARQISVSREALRAPLPVIPIKPGDSLIWDGRFRVQLADEAPLALEVRALGDMGIAQLKALRQGKPGLPARHLALAMPGFWDGERLVGVPQFGFSANREIRQGETDQAGFGRGKPSSGKPSSAAKAPISTTPDPSSCLDHFSVSFLAHHMQISIVSDMDGM